MASLLKHAEDAIPRQVFEESALLQIPGEFLSALKGSERRLTRIEKEIADLFETNDPKKIIEGLDKLRSVRLLVRLLKDKQQTLKGLDSVLDPRSNVFRDAMLNKLYFAYMRRTKRVLPPVEWARITESKKALEKLEAALGPSYREALARASKRKIVSVGDIPDMIAPGTWAEWTQAAVQRPDLLFRKMGKLQAPNAPPVGQALATKPGALSQKKLIGGGHWNILKGNVGELLTHERQLEHLRHYQEGLKRGEFKNIEEVLLVTDVRYTFIDSKGVRRANKEFSDNMIVGKTKSGDYRILHVFEVKSGRDGAFEARKQLFKNLESKEAVGIKIPADGPQYRGDGTRLPQPAGDVELSYASVDPASRSLQKADPQKDNVIFGLFSARKTTYAPTDELKLNIDDGLRTTGDTASESLGMTWADLESFTALLFSTGLFKSVF